MLIMLFVFKSTAKVIHFFDMCKNFDKKIHFYSDLLIYIKKTKKMEKKYRKNFVEWKKVRTFASEIQTKDFQ